MQKKKTHPQILIVNVYMLTFYSSSGRECCFSLPACSQRMQIFNLVSYCNLYFPSFSFFLLSILNWLKNLPATIMVAALNLLVFYLKWLYDFLCIVFCVFSFVWDYRVVTSISQPFFFSYLVLLLVVPVCKEVTCCNVSHRSTNSLLLPLDFQTWPHHTFIYVSPQTTVLCLPLYLRN